MTRGQHAVGDYVAHPARPEWGPGRVLVVKGDKVTIYFRDAPGEDHNASVKTFRVGRPALSPAGVTSDPILDNLPTYKDGSFERLPPMRVTIEQGLEKFHSLFPLYFEDPRFIGDLKDGERAYKWAAHELFQETLGSGQLGELLSAGDVAEARRRAMAVEGRVNLLAVFEKAAFRDGMRDDEGAHRLLSSLDDVLKDLVIGPDTFVPYLRAVEGLPGEEGKTDPAKWTVSTVLPYLADPSRFMFLKPGVTKACAARLVFDMKYSPQLRWVTYAKLMEMSAYLLERLRPYGARDYIDVQSFIWVIGGGWD